MSDRKEPPLYNPQNTASPHNQPQYSGAPITPAQSYQPYNADAVGQHYTGSSNYGVSPQTTGAPQPALGYYASHSTLNNGASAPVHEIHEMEVPGQHIPASPPQHSYEQHQQQQQSSGFPQQQAYPQQPHTQHNPQQHPTKPMMAAPAQGQHPPQQAPPPDYSKYRTAMPIANLGAVSAPVDCPNCGQRTLTKTRLESGGTTNAWALGLCLVACLGCIPYCISSTKDVVHNCGNCGCNLATWHRSGRTDESIWHSTMHNVGDGNGAVPRPPRRDFGESMASRERKRHRNRGHRS